jgi:serine/threonine-protein kinase
LTLLYSGLKMALTPDRSQKLEAVYYSALERDPAARAAFLDSACGQDNELRREVESMLAGPTFGGALVDRPAPAPPVGYTTGDLMPGTLLGPYRIEALIGQGGMGKVYKTRDTRLGRTVAIKTSSARFSERFEREARAVAALNHPHICHLHDVGLDYLVMEYIEGTPLLGPMPVDLALKYAEQILDALDSAHRSGITHRDLKPANILVSKQGIKLLDFGLALIEAGPDTPTMMQSGPLMGTPAYMAPEQWEGRRADARSDIYSFGCVFYEMLTGKIARTDRVPIAPPFEDILQTCLERDPDDRWQSARELKHALRWANEAKSKVNQAVGATASASPNKVRIPWVVAAAMLLAAALGIVLWAPWRSAKPVDRPMTRFSVDLGPDAVRGARITAALSPDGERLVFTGRAEGGLLQLFTRRLDQTEAVPLAGTAAADTSYPFFSPDGKWIGFIADGKIHKVAAQGGAAVVVGDAPQINMGAGWGDDGNILAGSPAGLMRIPASGGVAQEVQRGAGPQLFPQVLPGATAVIFNTVAKNNVLDNVDIEALEFKTGRKTTLLHGGYFPRYLATSGETGHLVYMHDGTLFGVAFNPKSLEVHGTPTPLLDDVLASSSLDRDGGGQFAFSENGTFVYLSGRVHSDSYPMLAMDASGKAAPLLAPPGAYGQPRFSPDGKRLAYTAPGSKGVEVWAYDLDRDTSTQLTFTGPGAHELAWAPDSRHLVFGDGTALWWIRADGSGPPQMLLSETSRPFSFSPEGRLVYSGTAGGAIPDIRTLPLDLSDPEHPKPGKVELFLSDPHVVNVDPAFSPDGKFLAYCSSELGGEEVFVRSFPGPGGKWKVSAEGGKFPAWSRTAHELLFLGSNDRIMVSDYTLQGDSFSAGKPRVWSPTQIRRTSVSNNFDLAPDGKRVVFFPRPAEQQSKGSLHATFLLNFFDELRRRVPLGK